MIVIISHPEKIENEASLIKKLFEAGLPIFHLRKPNATEQEVKTMLEQIKPEYRARVVLNQFYHLSEEFGIHRFHFSTDRRNREEHNDWKKEGNVLSTSTHSFEEYKKLDSCFDYAFLSPVFDSISKPFYKKVQFEIDRNEKSKIELIALGGIEVANCRKLKNTGFDGIAVLGGVWNKTEPIQSYKETDRLWSILDQ
jgi:thiamine-phosphate pyrophosphorylase